MTRIDGSHRMLEGLDGGAGAGVNLTNAVMKPILLLIFMGLQILDVLSTNLVLANGGWEANPLGVWAIANMGVWWWLPKLAVMLGLHARDEPLASALRGGGGGADERRRGQQSHSVKEGGGRAAGPRRRRRWRFPIHALTATFAISSASTLAQAAAPRRSERASSRRG
jgi:Domain of unknown function (DUF5658)